MAVDANNAPPANTERLWISRSRGAGGPIFVRPVPPPIGPHERLASQIRFSRLGQARGAYAASPCPLAECPDAAAQGCMINEISLTSGYPYYGHGEYMNR